LHRSRAALQFAAVKKEYHIAVVGATGAVGAELLRVLERRNFPVLNLRALASRRSAGKKVQFRNKPIMVEELGENSFDNVDIAFSARAERLPESSSRLPAKGARL